MGVDFFKPKNYETDRQMADSLIHYYALYDVRSKPINRGQLF